MSSFFPERANIFIDDHIVTPLLAKENEEANKITETYKYDPESNLTTTTSKQVCNLTMVHTILTVTSSKTITTIPSQGAALSVSNLPS